MHKLKLLCLCIVLLCLVSAASAQQPQLVVFNGFVAPAGYPFGPATIAVCASGGSGGPPCSPLVVIYTDASGTRQKPNPFTIDPEGNGNFNFFAACGTTYALQSFGSGYVTTLTTINTTACSGGGGGGPSGPASGDLNGTYPAPGVLRVNGGLLPTSKNIIGTNSGGQIVDASTNTLTNPLSVVHNPASVSITGASPSVSGGNAFITNNGSATTITNFLGGVDSQTIQVGCGDTNTSIANSSNIITFTGSTLPCTSNQAYQFTFYSSLSKWVQVGGGTQPAGSAIQTQVNNNGIFGGTPCETFDSLGGGPQRQTCDNILTGPNPVGIDIRAFGAVPYPPATTPANGFITANCNATTSITITSGFISFTKGAGIVVQGCGATNTMTTPGAPTVTTNLARVGEGTGDVTPTGLTGATTYNYKIVAQDLGMGTTAASATGSITTGPSSLGPQTATITGGCPQVANVATCTTTAAHGLVPGAEIHIINPGSGVRLFYNVSTVPSNTTFTIVTQQDVRNAGGVNIQSGATVTWLNCNHLTWSAVTNAYRYFIYSDTGSPGTFNLIGVSKPSYPGVGSSDGAFYFDDFGPGHTTYVTGAGTPVTWTAPATAPGSAINDALVTTIIAGAGTANITVANAAGQTVTGAQMRADNAPNIKAAACNSFGSPAYFPAGFASSNGWNFVTNSILDLSTCPFGLGVALNIQNQFQNFNDTVILGNPDTITGFPLPGYGSTGSFTSGTYPQLFLGGAPGMHFTFPYQSALRRFQFAVQGNGLSGVIVDGGAANSGFRLDDVNGGIVGGTDDTYIALHLRGTGGAAGQIVSSGSCSFGASQTAQSFAPTVYYADTANVTFHDLVFSGRGPLFQSDPAGSVVQIHRLYCQGCVTPLITVAGSKTVASNTTLTLTLDDLAEDTSFEQALAYLPSTGTLSLIAFGRSSQFTYTGAPAQYIEASGSPVQNINSEGVFSSNAGGSGLGGFDGFLNTTQSGPYAVKQFNLGVQTGPAYPVFVAGVGVPAPGLTLSAGGAVPTGNHNYSVSPVWPNGGDGPVSGSTTINVTTGNQTVNITWTPLGVAGGCIGYRITRDGQLLANISGTNGTVFGCSASSVSDTQSFTNGNSSGMNTGGPAMLMPSTKGIAGTNLVLTAGNPGTISPLSTGFTVNRTMLFPDITGIIPTTGYQNTVYDNFNRGSLGSNWSSAVLTGTPFVITTNQAVAPSGTGYTTQFYTPPFFSPFTGLFAQATVTALPVNTFIGVALGQPATGQAYACYDNIQSNRVDLVKITGQFASTFINGVASTPVAGDILRLEMTGPTSNPTFTCFLNGVSFVTGNDSSPLTFPLVPGIVGRTSGSLDNWSGGNLHPIGQLDTEQDWTQSQHFTSITVGEPNPIAGTLPFGGIFDSLWSINTGLCTDSTGKAVTAGCPAGSISGLTAGQVTVAGSATTITSSKAIQGTDASILSSGTVTGTAATLCTDANGGATTTGCTGGAISGMTTGQVAIAGSASSITSSKALQGTDPNVLTSSTIAAGAGNLLCTDTGSGATTSGCPATPVMVYNTQSAATTTNIAATSMVASTSALHSYLFSWTISLTVVGIGCSSSTTVNMNAVFTDPNASVATTELLGTITLAAGGNGTIGFVAQGADNILAKSGTAVQYSTTGYTAGTGCTTSPTYQVSPTLVQLW